MGRLEHFDVRLRGLEKRKERKECLQEGVEEIEVSWIDKVVRSMAKMIESVCVCVCEIQMVVRKKVNSKYVMVNVFMKCGGAYVGNEENKKYNKYKEGILCKEM
nr:hypothetical protein [Tanacetum cinerariifolium]